MGKSWFPIQDFLSEAVSGASEDDGGVVFVAEVDPEMEKRARNAQEELHVTGFGVQEIGRSATGLFNLVVEEACGTSWCLVILCAGRTSGSPSPMRGSWSASSGRR